MSDRLPSIIVLRVPEEVRAREYLLAQVRVAIATSVERERTTRNATLIRTIANSARLIDLEGAKREELDYAVDDIGDCAAHDAWNDALKFIAGVKP